jgi:hypothetical protein
VTNLGEPGFCPVPTGPGDIAAFLVSTRVLLILKRRRADRYNPFQRGIPSWAFAWRVTGELALDGVLQVEQIFLE